jgi:SPP1 gp7 family putative phage head morphogenesis protein
VSERLKVEPISGKTRLLAAIRPNIGVELAYQRQLEEIVSLLNTDVLRELRSAYTDNAPEMANDASPARILGAVIKTLARRWQQRLEAAGPELAKHFSKSVSQRTDASLKAALRRTGMVVAFRPTRAQNDVFQATVGQNVALIKSIAQEHLTDVQGIVMRAIQSGHDLGQMTKALEEQYGVTKRRAALIATTQSALATASMNKVRQVEVGITKAIWRHSHAGRVPRPSHVAADGKEYDVTKGMFLEGVWVQPGEAINCRCYSRAIIPGLS